MYNLNKMIYSCQSSFRHALTAVYSAHCANSAKAYYDKEEAPFMTFLIHYKRVFIRLYSAVKGDVMTHNANASSCSTTMWE